jgi:hypothetical protein
MKSGNAQMQIQRRHRRRSATTLNALLVTSTLLGLLLAACGTPTTDRSSAIGGLCPVAVQQLVDSSVIPDLEISLVVDGSGSFMGERSASRAFVAQQVALSVEEAVDKAAALRVIVFGGSAGNARTVVECPVMAVHYRNEAARAAKLAHLRQVSRDQVWLAIAGAYAGRKSRAGTAGCRPVSRGAGPANAIGLQQLRGPGPLSSARGTASPPHQAPGGPLAGSAPCWRRCC